MNELKKMRSSLNSTDKMPVLFLGHGSPMNAIEENEFVKGFRNIAKEIPTPTAVLCISAHWETQGTFVTAMENPKTIHDFGGFPAELFAVQYPAPGSPELAAEVKKEIQKTDVGLTDKWGLDHGTWSVIKHLYPNADVPVVQMSLDYSQKPQYHFDLAKEISTLRRKGVLIVGSGNMVHNLGMIAWDKLDASDYGYDWAIEANTRMNQYMQKGDFQSLINYESLGREFRLSVPTPDHFLPLLYVLGLKEENENLELFNDKRVGGSLSMTSVKIS